MPVSPSLLLPATSSLLQDHAYWMEDDNTGDPFIGLPYQWQLQMNVEPQLHSNGTTQTPYSFNAADIQIGDWYSSQSGVAVVIKEILESTFSSITVVVEDYERYNLFSDPNQSGSGVPPDGTGFFFRLNSDGLPAIGPMADYFISPTVATNLLARFMARNMVSEFVLVRQELHGFLPGDVIYADFETDSGYKKVTAANFGKAIGIVTEVNVPGLHYFSYRPLGRLINNVNPPLWGEHGDVFYLDPNEPGALTNERPAGNAIPVYLQLDLPTRAILLERGADTSKVAESETNKYDVESVVTGQTTFIMPVGAKEILYMAINGIENENFTFDKTSRVLEFDPVETGYGIDVDDEVFFIYKS